jgi:hypothetical protein
MWQLRYLPIPLGLASLWLLTAAMPDAPPSSAPSAAAHPGAPTPPLVPSNQAPDPLAAEALARAVDALAPDRAPWLTTALWQRVHLPSCTFTAQGRYLTAPGRRFRLELRTHQANGESELLAVGDGRRLWQAERLGRDGWAEVTSVDLDRIAAKLAGPGGASQAQQELTEGAPTRGVTPLLRDLRDRLVWVGREVTTHDDQEYLELTGVWRHELFLHMAPGKGAPWPEGLARSCRLILDAESSWPRRVEWWGPDAGGATMLLAELEFRSPRVNEALTEEQCRREFHFDPGSATVKDRTDDFLGELLQRAAAP